MHYAEMQDEKQNVLWRGKFSNSRDGLNDLIKKISTIEESNNDTIYGIFMNPTGNYHVPLKYFLEQNGHAGKIFMVDARRTVHLRKIMNLGTEKSDPEDAHVLASTPWLDRKFGERFSHERDSLSELTREREIILRNVTRITNHIHADLNVVFPEFTDVMALDSKTGMAILEKYTVPENITKLTTGKLLGFMQKAGRNHFGIKDAEKLLNKSRDSIGIPDPDGVYTFRIRTNVNRLRGEISSLKSTEKEIESRSSHNRDVSHLADLKGIGPVNAATIVSEIGDIGQFNSAVKL